MAEQVSFTLPSPYQAEMADIARRQRMAELMQQQAFQPAETFSYNGIQARTSPLTGIAKALQGYMAVKTQKDLANEQKALGERAQKESASDFATLFAHMQGQEAQPERAPITAIDDQGNFEPNRPAVPARARGTVDPSILAALRDPQAKQLAMSQLLAQMTPKAPISVKPGEILVNPTTYQPVYTAPAEDEIKETKILKLDGKPTLFGITKSGKRINLGDAEQVVSPDTEATLKQARELADRAYNGLSVFQRADLANRARQLGINERQLFLHEWQAKNPAMSFHEGESGPVAFNSRTGTATPVLGADGKPLQGGKPLSESQGKATTFATRAAEADEILNTVGQGGKVQPGLLKRAGESIPFVGEGLGTILNATQSSEQQRVEQAQRNFVNAILRQESGASISPAEFASAQKQYFPQPGEDAETILQKAANRRTAIAGMKVQAGPGMQRMQNLRNEEDQAALEWANANPNDPRAAAIKRRLGQ
jgi:hypothetical protein